MKKVGIFLIFDLIFIFLAIFSMLFTVLVYFSVSSLTAFLLCFLICAVITFCIFIYKSQKLEHRNLTKQEQKLMQECFVWLSFMDSQSIIKFFTKVFKSLNFNLVLKDNVPYLEKKEKYIYFLFAASEMTVNEFASALKGARLKSCLVFANNLSQAAYDMAHSLGINLIYEDEIFKLCKAADIFPEKITANKKPKKALLNIDISRKKAKTFLFFGIVSLAFSLIVAFPIYYLTSGSLMILFALFLKFWGKAPNAKQTNFKLLD